MELGNGRRVPEVCKTPDIHEVTYYRWGREYGGLKVDLAKRMKEPETENARLKEDHGLAPRKSALEASEKDQNYRGSTRSCAYAPCLRGLPQGLGRLTWTASEGLAVDEGQPAELRRDYIVKKCVV